MREINWNRIAGRLREAAPGAAVLEEEPLCKHTTFQTGGPGAVFVEPENAGQLAGCLAVCREEDVPCTILGRGSNVLAADGGWRGVGLRIGDAMGGMTREGDRIETGAGVTLAALAHFAKTCGLAGLEFAAGIPGSLGGALSMNAGAYGGEMKDVVEEVLLLEENGETVWVPVGELAMGYRTSRIQREGRIALAARIRLHPDSPEAIQARMNELAERRRSKQPLEYPSAGSTFKRPEGYFAGKLIQDAGLAGYTVGGACVSEKHCGFVINRDHATSADVMAVCRHAAEEVKRQFGVDLEMEVRLLGDF